MVANLALPAPSARDFEVYRRVVLQRATTRVAAAEAELSQTRIVQIVKRVTAFMQEVVPGADEEPETRRRRLFVAEQVASERMSDMNGEMFQAWRDSKGPVTTYKSIEGTTTTSPVRTATRRMSQGDTKYVTAAFRAAREAGKFP